MASKDSTELGINERYPLGDYNFRIERTSVPGSSNDKIEAICTNKDGKNARKSIQIPSSTKIEGWYVEANETEASVYIQLEPIKGNLPHPIATAHDSAMSINPASAGGEHNYENFPGAQGFIVDQAHYWISDHQFTLQTKYGETGSWVTHTPSERTVYGKPVWVYVGYLLWPPEQWIDPGSPVYHGTCTNDDLYIVLYGIPDAEDKLVGRFAIDIDDAGGVGPGSDWIDPGDYDPDWEEGDPTHTLYVEVTGALSGRHNDPIVDPSYSYIPADKDTVKDYGCGGDGGHGGGGGAGASTVVVHKFATNQANSKEVTAIARRHGYGSGGGKGGKGGDGCILVYY